MTYPSLPVYRNDRVIGMYYLKKDEIVIWNGKTLHCVHGKRKSYCVHCSGASLCQEHKKVKWTCKDCNKSIVCSHGNVSKTCYKCASKLKCDHHVLKFKCKVCCSAFFCRHGKNKFFCIKCCPDNYEKHKEYIRKKLFYKNSKHVVERDNVGVKFNVDDDSLISDLFPEIF